jgi:DNA-binding beta-propeller fold protein YncE
MGDPRILKFDKTGKFIKQWGGRGTEPGKFRVAHGLAVDAKGLLWVTDRENSRIQVFDQDGNFQREIKYAGLPCSLLIRRDGITMVNGFTGQILELDLDGKVLGVYGKTDEFGEAHNVAVSPKGEIFVGDVTKGILKFVKK